MNGADVLALVSEWGEVRLVDGRLEAEADAPPPEELRALVDANRGPLKAVLLLLDPPAWLARLFDLYWSDHDGPVRRTSPTTGKAEVYMVSVSMKNIAAAVCAEVGLSPLEWERILPEVEEAIGSWDFNEPDRLIVSDEDKKPGPSIWDWSVPWQNEPGGHPYDRMVEKRMRSLGELLEGKE